MAMSQTVRMFVLCVDSNLNPHGEPFELPMPSESSVSVLIREARSLTPTLLGNHDVTNLKVWKLKQPVNFNATYLTDVYRILQDAVTFEDNHHVQRLAAWDNIAQHFVGSGTTLQAFIQFPASDAKNEVVGGRVDSNLVRQYESIFITLENFKVWTNPDVHSNGIQETVWIPPFVEEYERMLGTKRRVPINLLSSASPIPEYWDAPGSEVQDTDINMMTEDELLHLAFIASIEPSKWWLRKGRPRTFKQADAAWLLFYAIASPYGPDEVGGISVKVGEDPWPFQIIVQDNRKECRSYGPKNDFTALGSSLPRLLIEVNSFRPDESPQNHYRMLLQAASVIRFANQFLEAYKRNKSCILVAAYVGSDGNTERYILFQDKEGDPRIVYYKKKDFQFNKRVDRILFALELYNFFSALGKEGRDEDAIKKIQAFRGSIKDHRDEHGLMSLTSGQNKRRRTGERNNRDSDDRGNGGSGGAAEELLETHGDVVIPDFFEDKGGLMEPLIKLPPHIRTVYRSTDATKTELVAKHVDEESIELEVLEYLRTIQPQSSRIISLIDTVPTNTGKWAILPKMRTVRGDLSMFSGALRCDKFTQLGWDLIEGLAYLHEHGVAHLDIKPGNLVYTDDFRLQIIDFNSAVRVGSEDDMVKGVYGTRGWMAPEIREGSVYSPIRADRWSCGKVLLCFVEKSGTEGGELESFAEQLMDDNPLHRPSLVDWSGRVDVTLCDDDDTDELDEGRDKESKAQVKDEVRGDGELENRTKRRRVDVGLKVDGYHELPTNHQFNSSKYV